MIDLISPTYTYLQTKATPITYYYKDTNGEWRWRLKSASGNIIADSGEGYKNEADCLAGVEMVKNSRDAPVVKK